MKLKRIFIFFGILISLLITSCSRNVAIDNEPLDTNYGGSKTLIAYFSFSGIGRSYHQIGNPKIISS